MPATSWLVLAGDLVPMGTTLVTLIFRVFFQHIIWYGPKSEKVDRCT